jgi:hypothetical protein
MKRYTQDFRFVCVGNFGLRTAELKEGFQPKREGEILGSRS